MNETRPLLALLPKSLARALTASGQEKHYKNGQHIHTRGTDHQGLSIIMNGRVGFGIYGEDGGFIQTGVLGEGHCFGEATLFLNKPRPYDADALGKTTVVTVSKPQLDALLAREPALTQALLVTLTSRLYQALEFSDDTRTNTLEVRVAKVLLRLQQEGCFGDNVIRVRQVDLAFALGQSRVSVGKALTTLKTQGLLTLGYGEIHISDLSLFKRWIAQHQFAR
ncbi:hypothetical protein BST95_14305 [Halioglobus japonicus]|uniref:Crp/Fnr family transcriptional regulator n=1 Tax=Halioglobus japonicus TaxID=930805 RepID=A0AAP8SQ04_9GAMM|nr:MULTISPECIES: Crp/Fnr family transcriptional regulator [Halioglobus]AQA19241.1 hypothetical protein BST95_14305 [Halioglobus japonicus]KZX59059.1 hypothetical protein A3709_16020 [Halioglobus sp. HI00S01]PLW87723.1 Crp/Fnr family transcriptional regulator [Halioglobus japonicus]GHD06934.1 hypothetical protein GCM10007052_02170 [Halioglobus japonicus]